MDVPKELLQERYEIRADERDFLAAKPLYEEAIETEPTASSTASTATCSSVTAGASCAAAAEHYRRALELDPDADKARYSLIAALADVHDGDEMIALYEQRVAEAPEEVRNHRFLARAYLASREFERARGRPRPGSSAIRATGR